MYRSCHGGKQLQISNLRADILSTPSTILSIPPPLFFHFFPPPPNSISGLLSVSSSHHNSQSSHHNYAEVEATPMFSMQNVEPAIPIYVMASIILVAESLAMGIHFSVFVSHLPYISPFTLVYLRQSNDIINCKAIVNILFCMLSGAK